MFKLVALTVLLAISGSDAFFRCCANQPNVVCPTRIDSPSCSGDRCTVTRGQVLQADAHFVPLRAHSRLDVAVTATVSGITINLPPPQADACTTITPGCPTTPNVNHVWRINYEIPRTITAMPSATIRYMLRENGQLEGCVDLQATIL